MSMVYVMKYVKFRLPDIKESSEVQSIQVADGNVSSEVGLPILLHMVFPRWFAAATINTNAFKVAFEVNINIVFSDNHVVTENIPLILCR